MNRKFYDNLIIRQDLIAELDLHALDPEECDELIEIIDQTFHHHILDLILTHLPRERHEEFLIQFYSAPHNPELLNYLKSHVSDIEDKITTHASQIKSEILSDIRKSKKTFHL